MLNSKAKYNLMSLVLEQMLQFGIKGFMLLTLTLIGFSQLVAAFSPGTRWKVNPFKGLYHSGLLANEVLPIPRLMNYSRC